MPIALTVYTRAREESGFGLLELLMAMVMLNVGILAIVAAFSSGNAALARASRISTASALANKQVEAYRGLIYDNILFTTTEWTTALADSSYTADMAYQQNMLSPVSPKALVATVTNCPTNVPTTACDPSYTTTGADHRSYRVDRWACRASMASRCAGGSAARATPRRSSSSRPATPRRTG